MQTEKPAGDGALHQTMQEKESRGILMKSDFLNKKIFSFAQDLSVIGSQYCVDKSRSWVWRASWIFLIIFGTGFAAYQIEDRISFFLSYPTTTDIEMVEAKEFDFPQVTICNENAARMSVAAKYGIVDLLTAINQPLAAAGLITPTDWSKVYVPNFTNDEWEKVRQELAQPKTDVFYSCRLGDGSCGVKQWRIVQTNMGQCVAIRAADYNFSVTRPGSPYGLTLGLFTNQAEYLGTVSPSAGFRILFHDPNEFPLMLESGIQVSPGFISSIAVTFNNITRQPPPYGSCLDTPGYYQSGCQLQCESDYVYDKCGCRYYYMPGNTTICNYLETFNCAQYAIAAFNSDPNGGGSCICPLQCNSKLYSLTISQDIFSNRFSALGSALYKSLNLTLTKQIIMENYLAVQVYFTSMQYLDIRTDPGYSFMGLLSDIGGAFGLLLGSTVFTVLEIVEFLWEVSYFYFSTKIKDSRKSEKTVAQLRQTK